MVDVYRTPDADLSLDTGAGFPPFERFSAWGVFGLSVITFGIYMVYWLYSRTQVLNAFHSNKISDAVINLAMIGFILNLASSVIPESYYESLAVSLAVMAISIGYLVFYLIWLFGFRARLLEIAHADGHPEFRVNPVLTFFFSNIYLQYKINQYIDRSQGWPQRHRDDNLKD